MGLRERLKRGLERQYYQARKYMLQLRIGNRWEKRAGFVLRQYPDYQTYLEHQKTKYGALRDASIARHDRRFHAALAERLASLPIDFRGAGVLCLAARQGTEVRTFIEQGAFAVGIDLNPGREPSYVLAGDFHDLQFAAASIDFVYTNSLDHAFDLERILAEVRRVLKPGGRFILEANVSSAGAAPAGRYEATVWSSPDVITRLLERSGFAVGTRTPFEVPWTGEQLVLRVREPGGA